MLLYDIMVSLTLLHVFVIFYGASLVFWQFFYNNLD